MLPIRYFLKRRITSLAVVAVALCVFIVVVVMTIMGGLVGEFKEKNHQFVGDCIVSTDSLVGFAYYEDFLSELNSQDFVDAASAVIRSYGIFTQQGAEWSEGVGVMGLEPVSFCKATGFGRTLYYNRSNCEDAFVPGYAPERPGCVVGVDLPRMSGRDREGNYYHSEKPMQVALMVSCFPLTAKGILAKLGTDVVNRKTFYFSDDSHSGIAKVDGRMIYIPFDMAQMLCGMDGADKRASAIHIKFSKGVSLDDGCKSVKKLWHGFIEKHRGRSLADLFENVKVQSWIDHRRQAIAPMEKEQTMLILLFLMLGVITVFVIFVVFYMIISHKSKDIGILKSVGVGVGSIIELFLRFAVIVGFVGAAIGGALGCLFLWKINVMEDWLFERFGWQLWNRSIYAIGDIPDKVEWQALTVIVISAIAASVIGALLPSLQAAIRQPAKILQVDQL